MPAEPTFPLFGNALNDKDVGVNCPNAWLVDDVDASIESVRMPAATTAAITDIEICLCIICCNK
ncbi:MAG TPA: hypothetical protein VEH06_10780 [Candidatus Bathyarchaeia archaeon]|nr:hypothetical protein [Candidatus Bathyarchaeia archaeon]